MSNFLGIEIGGTKLQVVAQVESLNNYRRFIFTVAKSEGAQGIRDRIESSVKELLQEMKFAAIGVGFGGPVDWQTGKICCSHHIQGWSEFPIADWLRSMTGAEVFVDNDGNVAALGEASQGAGVGFNPVFYVTLGSGVGGGLVVDGKIYHGMKPGEAEIGHLRLDKGGRIVESSCSGWAVDRKIREAISHERDSILAKMVGDSNGGEAKFLKPALEQNDPLAQRILKDTADDLAFALSHAVHLFHPEIIVLGGGLSLTGEPLRSAVERALPVYLMEAFAPGPKIALAGCGENAVPAGALHLARSGFVARPSI